MGGNEMGKKSKVDPNSPEWMEWRKKNGYHTVTPGIGMLEFMGWCEERKRRMAEEERQEEERQARLRDWHTRIGKQSQRAWAANNARVARADREIAKMRAEERWGNIIVFLLVIPGSILVVTLVSWLVNLIG